MKFRASWTGLGVSLLTALSFGLLAADSMTPVPPGADLILDFVSDFKGSLEPCG